jgi:hypothetical protein
MNVNLNLHNPVRPSVRASYDNEQTYQVGQPWEPDSEINFHAYKLPLDMRTTKLGHIDSGFYVIVRSVDRDGAPYPQIIGGPVTERYRIFQNREIFNCVEQILGEVFGSSGHVTCSIVDQLAWHGGASIRQYIITNSLIQVGKSRLYFRVIIKNAFDTSTSFVALAGAIDGFCSNGRIFGEFVQVRQRHVKALNMEGFAEWLKGAYEQYGREIATIEQMQLNLVTHDQARELLLKLSPDNKKFAENIGAVLLDNIGYHGSNLWAVVSTATWWSSTQEEGWAVPSAQASQLVAPVRTLDRQQAVQRWTNAVVLPFMREKKEQL